MTTDITPSENAIAAIKFANEYAPILQGIFHVFAKNIEDAASPNGPLHALCVMVELNRAADSFTVRWADKKVRFSWGMQLAGAPITNGVVAVHRLPSCNDLEEVQLLGQFNFDESYSTDLKQDGRDRDLNTRSHCVGIVTHYLYLAQQHAFALRQTPQHR